jgi:transcription antitermination factor NusG
VEHKWYIVHTYSGFEHKVKLALEEHIKSLGKEELFSNIPGPHRKSGGTGQRGTQDLIPEILSGLYSGSHGTQ